MDQYSIQQIGIPSMVLMERAALAVVQELERRESKEESILCICGTGNNGGDGIAVARILHQKGYKVACELVGDTGKCTKDNKVQQEIAKKLGVKFVNNGEEDEYTVVVDALFGIGLTRIIEGEYKEHINGLNRLQKKIYAIDIPSGISTDSGQVMGCAIQATCTITFGYAKNGVLLYPGAEYAGELVIADIGFSRDLEKEWNTTYFEEEDVRKLLPARRVDANKGTYGKVLIIAGSHNMAGACYFSAKAAYYTGAGLVKIISCEENREVLQQLIPEAVLITYSADTMDQDLQQIQREVLQADAIVVGPGLGRSKFAKDIVKLVVENSQVPTVLDADALHILAEERKELPEYDGGEIQWGLPSHFIVTPHLKEMVDMLGANCSIKMLKEQKMEIAEKYKKNSCVLVLKDARTLVLQGEKCYINLSGNDGMATGGSGDVLTGIIAGLLGQGMDPYAAAMLGTFLHGRAGDYARKRKGRYSMLAQDIILALSEVLQEFDEEW